MTNEELNKLLTPLVEASKQKFRCHSCNLEVQVRHMTNHIERYCKFRNPELAKALREKYPAIHACNLI